MGVGGSERKASSSRMEERKSQKLTPLGKKGPYIGSPLKLAIAAHFEGDMS
jgi:hypothetical protein